MAVAASVVVPVYNPGPNLDDCLASLLGQTLSRDAYEIILVDDGSTDGTADRLDSLAAEHPDLVQVRHIPNSGWPSRPRNVGIDIARGDYIQFVDNDDALAPDALRRLVEVARSSDADVVAGKLSSDFRGVKHSFFRDAVQRRTLADYPFEDTLTPHKMFRRQFLDDHGIRFVEGIRNLEDQIFCMHAYVHAESMAVVADTACYFYRRRRAMGRNAGDRLVIPADYYGDLEKVLDVVDRHIESRELKARVQRRFYRSELLGRIRERAMIGYPPDYRADICAEVRRVAEQRLLPEVHDMLPPLVRTQSALLRRGDIPGMIDYSEQLVKLRYVVTATDPRWEAGELRLRIDGVLWCGEEPLILDRDDEGWLLPEWMAPTVPVRARRVSDVDVADADVDVVCVSRRSAATWSASRAVRLSIAETGSVVLAGEVGIDPRTTMGGRPLDIGLWDVRLRVEFAGLTRNARIAPRSAGGQPAGWLSERTVWAYWTLPTSYLALDVGEWSHPLSEQVAGAELTAEIRRRRLSVTLGTIAGESSCVRALRLWLVAADAPDDVAPLSCSATLTPGAEGVTLRSSLPRLPRAVPTWEVRVGEAQIGASEPVATRVTVLREGRRVWAELTP